MAKIIQYIQDITIDPIHGYGTSIREYAIPKEKIIFNRYAEQINLMDGVYFVSRFAKGRQKQEIEVPDNLVANVIVLNQMKKQIMDALSILSSENKGEQLLEHPQDCGVTHCDFTYYEMCPFRRKHGCRPKKAKEAVTTRRLTSSSTTHQVNRTKHQ